MRNAILKRASAGFMAVAIAAGMFLGMSFSTSAATPALPTAVGTTGLTVVSATVGTVPAQVHATLNDASFAKGVIAIPNAAKILAGQTITVKLTTVAPAGIVVTDVFATESLNADGDNFALATDAKFTVTKTIVPSAPAVPANEAQPKGTDLAAITTTIDVTMTAKADVDPSTTYLKVGMTSAYYGYAFWGSITNRRLITTASATAKTIDIWYTAAADPAVWQFKGDTLPTITIGQLTADSVTAGKTIATANQSTDYYTATIAKDGKIKLNGVEYVVTFHLIDPLPLITNATLMSANMKAKTAYTMTLNIGSADYTLNKDTAYDADIISTDATPVVTFKNVASLTGFGTVTFKGALLYADQAFTVSTAALTSAAGAPVTLVYRDGTTQSIKVKANAAALTKNSTAYNAAPLQTDDKAMVAGNKRFTVIIDGALSTKYPAALSRGVGFDTLNISLVNDTLPAKMQVKVESSLIAGGSKTFDVKFYDQIFPVELADGAYTYLSVVIKSIKNDTLPVSAFDFIGIASSNIDVRPLITWDQSNAVLNKTLFVDLTGVLTDRTTNSGVLSDGTTGKIFPSTSYYQPNADYNAAYWFYARWKVGADMFGTSVKYTRPYITFDVTDATSKLVYAYNVVIINSKQDIYATATNSTLGGQVAVTVDTGEYSQKWKQADAATQFAKDGDPTKTKGKINLTAYYSGTPNLDEDYVIATLRLPRGCTLAMDTTAGSIKSFEILQSWSGTVGNTTTDGLIDYVVKFMYREFTKDGSATGAANVLNILYPLTKKDGKSASATSFKDYEVMTTWVAKSYTGEKKVTMAGVTVPNAIVEPSSSAAASSVKTSSTAPASSTISSSTSTANPINPDTGVPFNALAYVVTLAASAIGGVSTMIIRKK